MWQKSSITRNLGTWKRMAQISVHTQPKCITLSPLAKPGGINAPWSQVCYQLFSLMVAFSNTDMIHHEKSFENVFLLNFKICSGIGGVSRVLGIPVENFTQQGLQSHLCYPSGFETILFLPFLHFPC